MQTKRFSLNLTVTLSLIVTIFIQTAGALIWAGAAEARIKSLEAQAEEPITERLARLEEQMIMARQSLSRIEQRLED